MEVQHSFIAFKKEMIFLWESNICILPVGKQGSSFGSLVFLQGFTISIQHMTLHKTETKQQESASLKTIPT